MSLGNLKKLQAAERLLKQGKTSEALAQLERLAKDAPSDVLTINRMGDLLARQGRTEEAIGYFFRIARHYTSGGYLPKAIAIYKKIVRLDPKSSESLARLGELYLKQKLPAEAQRFLVTAAQQYEEAGNFAGAREAYERLVQADPGNPLHRAKLADAMASAGDDASALAELLNLGDTLQRSGRGIDAEKIYRRAHKLNPDSAEAVLGVSRAMGLQGNAEGAIECLEESVRQRVDPQVLSELALAYERAGRTADTEQLLRGPGGEMLLAGTVVDLMGLALSRGEADGFWDRMDRVFADWQQRGEGDKVGETLERLTAAEAGQIPALERLERRLSDAGHAAAAAGVIERLVDACRANGDKAGVDRALRRLKIVAPTSSLLGALPEVENAAALPAGGMMPNEFEAPAVPLNRADKDFVTGRLTQAEILEKYSLLDQAMQQVLEVTARFPGHVAAQEKLLSLRRAGDPATVRDTLVSLALAHRAAGDAAAAGSAAAEAVQIGDLDPRTEQALEQLGLLGGAAAPTPLAVGIPDIGAAAAQPVPSAVAQPDAGESPDSFLIDFDAEDEATPTVEMIEPPSHAETPPQAAQPSESAGVPLTSGPLRAPGPDMLAEIRQHLKQGRAAEAQKGIIALESLGYGSDDLEALAVTAGAMLERAGQSRGVDDQGGAAVLLDLDELGDGSGDAGLAISDADDLTTIAAALEGEAAQADGPLTPDAGTEQSVDEVFAAFRQAVEEEVGEDSRTHYDLAIGYKEMGLVEEAIEGFTVAAKAPTLARESNMMLAVCHRDLGNLSRAVEHYRLAVAMDCPDAEVQVATHYDLAEALIQAGDDAAALEQLRRVLDLAPGYRDVRQRIDDLETRLEA